MKLLLSVLKRVHKPPVYASHQRRLCSCASSGLIPLRYEALIVGSSPELVQTLGSQVEVRTGFITEEEEGALLRELEPGLKKKRYEFDHWDDAIHGYRETERVRWEAVCEEVLNRVRSVAFPKGSPLLGPVHILDLDKTGYIKPHIDSVKFCGNTIAGLSLLSESIMRLVKEDATNEWLDLLLPRRSLYILRDQARYNFTHEILKDEESVFNGQRVPRLRRISVICRNLPG
ncbi:alpha-ketoglutarate-dependent dioxygenase alkB homolog 7, mitochondrial [Siniperca chuatsi]|uniref:alpha-ketoglutarate-dependent dioxygenase alkB homolog 7, mitochondrial n=1 Tax=Siniperca chuatsi TaxID=119488 RepID=UPI001CE14D1D|nr:alpha-ketoglutarate-dependent dioxygenase alkB homolog 7, mitochondrial [Siniperca chuatsi]